VFFWHSAKKVFAECFFTLGKAASLSSVLSSVFFAECFLFSTRQRAFLPSVRKEHSTNHVAHGKELDSGSDSSTQKDSGVSVKDENGTEIFRTDRFCFLYYDTVFKHKKLSVSIGSTTIFCTL
jgi:hypothetical protein